MKVNFRKYKFTNQIFTKSIDSAEIEKFDDHFEVKIMPYFTYSGKYYIESIIQKDKLQTVYRVMKRDFNDNSEIDFDYLNPYNEYFISLRFDGCKVSIFKQDLDGIILKL